MLSAIFPFVRRRPDVATRVGGTSPRPPAPKLRVCMALFVWWCDVCFWTYFLDALFVTAQVLDAGTCMLNRDELARRIGNCTCRAILGEVVHPQKHSCTQPSGEKTSSWSKLGANEKALTERRREYEDAKKLPSVAREAHALCDGSLRASRLLQVIAKTCFCLVSVVRRRLRCSSESSIWHFALCCCIAFRCFFPLNLLTGSTSSTRTRLAMGGNKNSAPQQSRNLGCNMGESFLSTWRVGYPGAALFRVLRPQDCVSAIVLSHNWQSCS